MESKGQIELPKFSSPEEELKYLRERVAHTEQKMWQESQPSQTEAVISKEVIAYSQSAPASKLEEHMILENPKFEEVVAHIGSLPHREKVRDLYRMLAEKGILNAVRVAQAQNNPHIEEDFHRVLVEYIKIEGKQYGQDIKPRGFNQQAKYPENQHIAAAHHQHKHREIPGTCQLPHLSQ